MTEALRKWIDGPDFELCPALSLSAADFLLRSFCEEVERRATQQPGVQVEDIFWELKRELLG